MQSALQYAEDKLPETCMIHASPHRPGDSVTEIQNTCIDRSQKQYSFASPENAAAPPP